MIRATYRLQLREGMTFERAAGLVSYWCRLGISHLYLSPVFEAVEGSTHGYDMTDPTRLDRSLGGETGFRRLAEALRAAGLGLVVDFVPNHMAASTETPWWRDVLRHGRASAFAGHFDIDWSAGALTLPFLGEAFGEAARSGRFTLERREGGISLGYFGAAYPLNAVGERLIEETRGDLDGLARDSEFLERLHALQHWRLVDWRTGRHTLSYRRFFEITGLVGLRVEEPAVFDEVHAKLLELVDTGLVDGIRLDHVDGLADPAAYLRRLRERVGPDVELWVEKILEGDEVLPADWPVEGTTGYEFIADLSHLLTDDADVAALDREYRAFTGRAEGYDAEVARAKGEIVSHNLAAELSVLTRLAEAAGAAERPEEDLQAAVAAALVSLPVYRTYVCAEGASETDRGLIADLVAHARELAPGRERAVEAVGRLLALEVPLHLRDAALAFAIRFQQTSAAVMAKAAEDTAFYRFNRLLALNEVGCDPDRSGGGASAWHARMAVRAVRASRALSATATHDTKRGEDARARLFTLAEAPARWGELVGRWSGRPGAPAIDRETEWLLYQALLGVWPLDEADLRSLEERFAGYAEKAVREAKRHTSWTEPDHDYEARVRGFVADLFAEGRASFRESFTCETEAFVRAGAVNGLAQLLLKLTAPGVPDVYQGTEIWDTSLVDPDNRRPPDFSALARMLEEKAARSAEDCLTDWRSGAPKQHVLNRSLAARAVDPALFAEGAYRPLTTEGPARAHVIAFSRELEGRRAIAIAPRRVLGRVTESGPLGLAPGWLSGTVLSLPSAGAEEFREVLTGRRLRSGAIDLEELLRPFPVALLLPS